jgi:hypothetical protein
MGRNALVLAIINEDLPMVRQLISLGVEAQDALLHAISEEFVEAVELLLDHEQTVTAEGQQHVRISCLYALYMQKLIYVWRVVSDSKYTMPGTSGRI